MGLFALWTFPHTHLLIPLLLCLFTSKALFDFPGMKKYTKLWNKGNVTVSHSFRMELYDKFYSGAIINLSMELSVFYVCSNFGCSFGPRTRTGTGPTQKTINWMFQSKVVTLKSPLVCHYSSPASELHTFSFEVPQVFRQQWNCFSKTDAKLVWCLNSSPFSTVHVRPKRFWHRTTFLALWQGLFLPQLPPNTSCVPWGYHALRASHSAPGEGQQLPPLHCKCCSNSGCVRRGMKAAVSAQRTQWAPGCSRGCARSPLTPANRRNLARGLFLIQNAWPGSFPAEILSWPLFQALHCSQVCHLQPPSKHSSPSARGHTVLQGKHPGIRKEFQPS